MYEKKPIIDKNAYALNGQKIVVSHDNLIFKSVDMLKKQNFKNICIRFNLKKLTHQFKLFLSTIYENTA